MSPIVVLAVPILLFWLGAAAIVLRGNRRMTRLASVSTIEPPVWPTVSIVFAARNEATTVSAAVPTMLALDYPNFELIAVDDRSDDGTGEILDQLAVSNPRLQVDHVRELPPGWIGKNHALHHGARRATGKWMLFTDADIHFAPDALRRAVAYAEAHELDLLAAVPQLHERGPLLGACVNAFSFAYTIGIQPWRIPDSHSDAHGSVGAFGLVRAAKYRELGGHEAIRLRPDDDIKLGKLFKLHGGRCELVHGAGALSVSWYHSAQQMISGLTKNAYACADYRWWIPFTGAAVVAALFLWPLAAVTLTTGTARWLYGGGVAIMLVLGCDQTRFTGGRWWHGILLPIGMAIFSYALLRSMVVTHWQGGVVWRGTHYPLRELKANRL
jgi:glycosyltransferase involved in cell wall biosynthesis